MINQKQRANLKEFYKGKKYQPLDLRAKQTRSLRRALSKVSLHKKNIRSVPHHTSQEDRKRVTERQHKKDIHFNRRKYVLKA